MTEKQFVYYEHKGADYILDTPNTELDFIEMLGDALETEEIVDKLNELAEENEQLKCGNKNLKATLKDFINICNRLQANPTDKQTVGVARDMLQNMGVDLE